MIGIAIQFTTCNLESKIISKVKIRNGLSIFFFFLFWIHIWSQHDGHLCMILLCNISHSLKKILYQVMHISSDPDLFDSFSFFVYLHVIMFTNHFFWICRKLTNFTWIVNITFSFKLCTCTNISMGKNIQIWRFKKNINYILNCVIY